MPMAEYMDWIQYFTEQQEAAEGKPVNLLELDEDAMFGALTGGSSG